jgi:predicted transcriptional regulator
MNDTTTMTIRLDAKVKAELDSLAQATRRSRSFLAAEAVSRYVERELAVIEGVAAGLEDMRAGRVVPHGQALDALEATLDRAAQSGRAK